MSNGVRVRGRARARRMVALAVLALMLAAGLVGPIAVGASASSQPKKGTWFEYKYTQAVSGGTGEYYYWWEKTKATGRYDVTGWGPDEAKMKVHQTWKYSNYDGKHTSGDLDRNFSFDLTDRLYTSPQTDLDEPLYNQYAPDELGQWLWVPPTVKAGDKLYILAENSTVTSTDELLWSRWVPRRVIEVDAYGVWHRDDDYGKFDYSYVDRLYFDKVTGLFFAERYNEWDTGTYNDLPAGFHYSVTIDVTDSSYEVEVDWGVLLVTYTEGILWILLFVVPFALLLYWSRWRARTFDVRMTPEDESHGPQLADVAGRTEPERMALLQEIVKENARSQTKVKMMRVWRAKKFPLLENAATDYFEPFLKHWSDKSLKGRDRVAVAVEARGGRLLGVAYYNKEGHIGTVLCKNTELNEYLRQFAGCKDFFSETQHVITPSGWMRNDRGLMNKLGKIHNKAYNVFETHKVYRLEPLPPVTYDAGLVRPMRREDLPEVAKLAKAVYRARARRWIRACLESDDLAYVAVVNGRIVGFGFACVCGTHGRLHTLGVDRAYRGRGIAKELHRARLEAMRLMGVTDVTDEIADWNLASIRISTLSGFKPIGKVFVETTRRRRIRKSIVRR